ncbi:hypothetical protein B0O80DRAFT_198178 [Mortierella sp. GBAus27b]|nr:hypothetical protein B0O80DRAFT_198178 [Mortierella sp. GBAus27b]
MLALQQPVNGSGVSRQSQAELQPGTPGPGHDFSTTGLQPQQPHQHPQVQPLQQPTTPLIQIQSVNESLHGPFPLSLHEQQQLPLLQRSLGPLDNPSSSWIVNDFPPLPRSSQATLNPGLMSQSYGSIHPLHQQQASRPTTASNAFQQQQQPHHNMQGQLHFMQQQQLAHFQGLESGQGIHSHLGAQVTPSLMDSPANTNVQHFQGLNQDASMGFDANRWNDATKSLQMDMFHIASPPLTPSGAMARSPGSFSSFGMNNNVKRPPLWPMDRAPNTPFPRQTLTPSQSSKASNLQHIPCKFFKSGACTAGKNCLFSHNRDPPSESMVCKYFLKGNCKFGAKCSLSHSFLAPDRKTSALLPSSNSTGRTRLERRASSSAILNNNLWPSEPLSPTYTSSLQHQTIQLNGNNVEFSMGRPASQHGISKSVMNRVSHDSLGNNLYQTSSREIVGNRTPFFEDDPTSVDFTGELRTPVAPPHFLESRVRQHLAAPLPIRQRSLPDIFRLTPLSHEGGALPASPFYQPGNKALFLSVSCEGGETSPSSPLRLHSIPEQNSQHGHHRDGDSVRRRSFVGSDIGIGGDDYTDSENEGSLDQGFLPSSLNDLLTTHERQCRQSRQEDVEPRSTMLPSPVSGSLRDGKDEDDVRLTLAPRVSLSGEYPPLSIEPVHWI